MKKNNRALIIVISVLVFGLAITACSSVKEEKKPFPKKPIATSGKKILGEDVYLANCAGCHRNGGNQIRKDKPVLQSERVRDKRAIIDLLLNPPPPMPKFEHIVNDPNKLYALQSYIEYLEWQANEF